MMMSRFKDVLSHSNASNQKKLLSKKIEEKLFDVKGFYLKELYLDDNLTSSIAIDRSLQALTLIDIYGEQINIRHVRCDELLGVELVENHELVSKHNRRLGLTADQMKQLQTTKQISTQVQKVKGAVPSGAKVLRFHTSKDEERNFSITLTPKRSLLKRKQDSHIADDWLNTCKVLIDKADKRVEDFEYNNPFGFGK